MGEEAEAEGGGEDCCLALFFPFPFPFPLPFPLFPLGGEGGGDRLSYSQSERVMTGPA